MRHLVTYDREAKANVAIAILRQHGIEAVPYGSENSAVEGPLMAFGGVQVMVVDDAEHDRALAILAAQGDPTLGVTARAQPAGAETPPEPLPAAAEMLASDRFRLAYLIAVVSFRVLGVSMLVFAADHATNAFEYYGRLAGTSGSSHDHYAQLINWALIRTGMYSAIALLLMYFSGSLAGLATTGIRQR